MANHTLDVVLETSDDRGRRRIVGRLCSHCGLIAPPFGGGFTAGSKAWKAALEAAAELSGDDLASLSKAARYQLEQIRRDVRTAP